MEEMLKELLGDSFREDLTKEEIQKFFKDQVLSSGEYENKNKAQAEKKQLDEQIKSLKKQIAEKMTDDEKKAAADLETQKQIEELQRQLAESRASNSKNTVFGLLADARTKSGIKDDDKDFASFISEIAFEDSSKSENVGKYIAEIVNKAYENGKSEATKKSLGKMGSSFSEGSEGADNKVEKGNYGKELAHAQQLRAPEQKKDFFKEN